MVREKHDPRSGAEANSRLSQGKRFVQQFRCESSLRRAAPQHAKGRTNGSYGSYGAASDFARSVKLQMLRCIRRPERARVYLILRIVQMTALCTKLSMQPDFTEPFGWQGRKV